MSIEVLQLKSGKKYRATLYINGSRKRSPLFRRIIDARLWEDDIKFTKQLDFPTFQVAAQTWLDNHCTLNHKPGTLIENKRLLKELLPVLGHKPLNELQPGDIENHLKTLSAKGLAKKSLGHRVGLIKAVYNWHIKRGLRLLDPCISLQKLRGKTSPTDYWPLDVVQKFLSHSSQKYAQRLQWIDLLYRLALNTGMRWGEMAGLTWEAIDLDKRLICIKQSWDTKSKTFQLPKSNRIRYVGINDTLLSFLQKYKSQGLVFVNKNNNPIDRHGFRNRHFLKDIRGAVVPKIRLHDLRHTFATNYMIAGGNIYDLQKILGHSSLTMTDRYAHFSPDHATQKANIINLG